MVTSCLNNRIMSSSQSKRPAADREAEGTPFDLKGYLGQTTRLVDKALSHYLPASRIKPATIHEAMRYSLFAGGKRMRPALCLAAAASCGGSQEAALAPACALECVHTYSLIHDDLPAMDNDDLRRGRPTSHKVYGEAMAILAGDALLTIAFEILTDTRPTQRYGHAAMVRELARASGSRGMIAGQVADMEAEGNQGVSLKQLQFIHASKTAALLTASLRLGGMAANATPRQLEALTTFGYHVGLAFQVVDDILDVTQSSDQLGKTAGKDQAADKATYPALMGLDRSKRKASYLTQKAFAALGPLGKKATALHALADYLLHRLN
jgi:geranylgeranyl diphosphate synthase type II